MYYVYVVIFCDMQWMLSYVGVVTLFLSKFYFLRSYVLTYTFYSQRDDGQTPSVPPT
jgi:hypothetical protein